MMDFNEEKVRQALAKAWSADTAVQWTPECPEGGQCNVTAVLAFDLFGGEILCTPLPGFHSPHFYNRIGGQRVDLTDGQFTDPINYEDTATSREHALNWVEPAEYETLRRDFLIAHSG